MEIIYTYTCVDESLDLSVHVDTCMKRLMFRPEGTIVVILQVSGCIISVSIFCIYIYILLRAVIKGWIQVVSCHFSMGSSFSAQLACS
jgi:hypothetical protein